MFKVLTNVRAPKSTIAEVETTPTSGNVKINSIACSLLDLGAKDYAGIAENDGKLYVFKGKQGVGSKVASASGKTSGSMQFSSENAYRQLGGNVEKKRIFTVSDEAVTDGGVSYFELTHSRDEDKVARKPKK